MLKGSQSQGFEDVPKIELHRHLEGSLRPEFLLRISKRNRLRLPFDDPQSFLKSLKYQNFSDFIPPFLLGVKCLRTLKDFEEAVVDLGQQMEEENIVYAEVTVTPQFYLGRPFSIEDLLGALERGRQEVLEGHGRHIAWITDLVRNRQEAAKVAFQQLMKCDLKNMGVVGLGLGGPEEGFPASRFTSEVERAKAMGLAWVPHAGENAGPGSIREAVELGARRIGHGIRVVQDQGLLREMADRKIHMEVCVGSNLALGLTRLEGHPLGEMFEAGCRLSLNTDDPVLFRTNMNLEWERGATLLGGDIRTLLGINRMALEDSLAGDDLKLKLSGMLDEMEGESS